MNPYDYILFLKGRILKLKHIHKVKIYYRYLIAQLYFPLLRLLRMDVQTRYRHRQFKVGKGSYGNPRIRSWGEGATCKIGSFCAIAPGVQIFIGGEHITKMVTT